MTNANLTLLELYHKGCLCGCLSKDEVWDSEEYCYIKEIRHETICDGRVKAMLVLQELNDGEV